MEFSQSIEKVWYAPHQNGIDSWKFDILPDGNFDLLFILTDTECRIIFTGPYTELRCVKLHARYCYFCVRFRPGLMPRVADVAPADLVNSWVIIPRVFGVSADEIGEKLTVAEGLASKRRIMESIFHKACLETSLPTGVFRQCISSVNATGGTIRVDDLARQAGMSNRSLERMFLRQIGISPKTFIRNVRFQNVLIRLRARERNDSLAALACDCGYFDQSHFIRDFSALAQRLPSRF